MYVWCWQLLRSKFEILKSELAPECAVKRDCSADFWEICQVHAKIRKSENATKSTIQNDFRADFSKFDLLYGFYVLLAIRMNVMATYCSMLQCVAVCRRALQCVAGYWWEIWPARWLLRATSDRCVCVGSMWQCVATRCSVLQCVAVCCMVLCSVCSVQRAAN